jgi:hypothetical protein
VLKGPVAGGSHADLCGIGLGITNKGSSPDPVGDF